MFLIISVPAFAVGILIALPVLLFWVAQRLFHRRLSKLNWAVIALVGLVSFVITTSIYVHAIITLDYITSIPSSPLAAEKLKYQKAAISVAFQHSITPPIFQGICTDKPEIICEIGQSYSLRLWDSNLIADGEPIMGGTISSLVSIIVIIFTYRILQKLSVAQAE
jgi:hypothetical protein